MVLDALDNPFSPTAPMEACLADLVPAVWTCANTFESAVAWFNSPWLGLRLWLWRLQWRKFVTEEKCQLFRSYIEDATSDMPQAWLEDGFEHGRSKGIPFPQAIKVSLMSRLHLTESQALNHPVGLAVWDHVTFMAQNSNVDVVSQEEMALWKLANPWAR